MIVQSYYVALIALIVATAILGLLFIAQHSQNKETMRNFHIAKRLMTAAYFCVAVGKLLELLNHIGGQTVAAENPKILLSQVITLVVAVSQALIFTLSCLLLLDTKSVNRKHLKVQVITVALYIIAVVACYVILPKSAVEVSVYVFTMMYFATLVYFTYCFTDSYRRFRVTMDNFYSEDLAARLRWIAIVFYAALAVGVFALVTAQYFNFVLGTAFVLTSLCFYTFFGIQLLNYQWQFEIIETPQHDESIESSAKINTRLLRRWIDEKQFMEQGITINNVAHYIGTNRRYLSEYINANKNMTFRQWINSLRLAEAKKLIKENPEMTLNEIAEQSGYSNARNLIRQFYQQTGGSPTVWKEKNLNS